MKKLLLAALLAGVVSTPAFASDETLTVANRTGYTINELYLSPHSANNWEEDVMGDETLETDTSVDIDFSKSEDTCMWDMKAVYDDGTKRVWGNINPCKISKITLFYNANTDVTSAKYE